MALTKSMEAKPTCNSKMRVNDNSKWETQLYYTCYDMALKDLKCDLAQISVELYMSCITLFEIELC